MPYLFYQVRFLSFILAGLVLRLFLTSRSAKNGFTQWLQTRVEISTPLTSWSRVLEGLYLKNVIGLSSPYEGDLVHEVPFMLKFYQLVLAVFGPQRANLFFILVDCANAFLIYTISSQVIAHLIKLEEFNRNSGIYSKLKDTSFLISARNLNANVWPLFAVGFYLFNPFSLASCIGMSTVVVHNFLLLLWLHFMLKGQALVSLVFLALHSHVTVYSGFLIVPTLSFLSQKSKYLNKKPTTAIFYAKNSMAFATLLAGVFALNLFLESFSTRFIHCTYLFTLSVPDLVPNMGVFWYFLTEMFDHFLSFFTIVFQLNVVIYTVPLTVRLKEDPIINVLLQISLLSVLKSYPNVGETSFYMSLLVPVIVVLFPLMRNFLVFSCMLLVSIVLAPIMFYLWLGSGGGNANFYFAITLVFITGQLFMLADIFHAHLKREFIKVNGETCPVDEKSKDKVPALFALE